LQVQAAQSNQELEDWINDNGTRLTILC